MYVCLSFLASPEELLSGEEVGHCDHQQGEDQTSYDSPEWGTDADRIKPCGDSAHGKYRTGEEVGYGIGKHRVLTRTAQTSALYLPLELQSQHEGSCQSRHSGGGQHV